MAEPKIFASLSSSLLARKGAAKPAMRPQGFGQGVSMEDLGWNDMGGHPAPSFPPAPEPYEHVPTPVTALTPMPRGPAVEEAAEEAVEEETPVVVEQQRAIEASFAPKPRTVRPRRSRASAPAAQLPRDRRSAAGKAKAAFTLRLDGERHLKLRLACAVNNQSAQQIVTEALDDFLDSLPELDAMARQASGGKRN
jgi:hypothetical protein